MMLRPYHYPDVCVQEDYTTVPTKSEVKISDVTDPYKDFVTCLIFI